MFQSDGGSLSKASDGKMIIHVLGTWLMKYFTLSLSLLPFSSTLSGVVTLGGVLPWVATGVCDLSSPCNTGLRLLLACLCCSGHRGASSFQQQQVQTPESLSLSLTENTGMDYGKLPHAHVVS